MNKIKQILTKNVEKIYPSKRGLEKLLNSGKKIKVYLGIDPTAPKLHLGHTIGLRKLQEFAELGHEAILLFGTGTVLVGDPSERNTSRQLITEAEIEKNIATWKNQVKPFLDFKKIKIKYNGDWLCKMTLKDIIKVASQISAVQLFKRDNFTRRLKAGDTVWYHETLYPLLQGYDSVVMNVDLEIGGTDQTFNMLIGRELQRKINQKEKYVLTLKMILGTDGQKMSKSSNNCIWLTDAPNEIYGKVMSLQDDLIPSYFEAFTNYSLVKIKKISQLLKDPKVNPLDYKKQLAFEITRQIWGNSKAQQAQSYFENVFQNKKTPTKMPLFLLKKLSQNPLTITDLLVDTSLANSRSQAKRLVLQKAVVFNQKLITNPKKLVKVQSDDYIKVGKKKWLKFK